MKHTKIVIAGIGGVGGYFGGKLAAYFSGKTETQIYFLARGENLKVIREKGLEVRSPNGIFTAHPRLATDKPSEIGTVDLIILATKTYDRDAVLTQLRPCIHADTVILPLLNGVDSREQLEKAFPENLVAEGCVYIVSRLIQPGVIENTGNIQTLYFGSGKPGKERLIHFEKLFRDAGIEASLSENIDVVVWEKFIFVSPVATATSYFDKTTGELLADKECLHILTALIEEVQQLARAKRIPVAENLTAKTLHTLSSLPFEATSSLHTDFRQHKPTELEALTGYVLREGKKHNLALPVYNRLYEKLEKRQVRITG